MVTSSGTPNVSRPAARSFSRAAFLALLVPGPDADEQAVRISRQRG
jgi:hypothetical protein